MLRNRSAFAGIVLSLIALVGCGENRAGTETVGSRSFAIGPPDDAGPPGDAGPPDGSNAPDGAGPPEDAGPPDNPGCGNGSVQLDEECDDGNLVDGDGCDQNCSLETCDDGVLNNNEAEIDCGGPCPACPGPPPILYLKFDEGTGTIASDQAGEHDATLSGASWVPGEEGTGIQFGLISGSNWGSATIPYADDLRLTESWSFAAWFRPDACTFSGSGNGCGVIWAQSAYWRYNTGVVVAATPGYVSVFMYTGFGSPNWDGWKRIDALAVAPWDDGEYHHLHVTFDADALTVRIYVDGELRTEETTLGPAIYGRQSPTVIGRQGSGNDSWSPYHGALDEMMLWDRVVSPQYPMP